MTFWLLGTFASLPIFAFAQNSTVAAPRVSVSATYTGSADASGAVSLGTNYFVVGDDEDNTLRIYRRHGDGAPVMVENVGEWNTLQAKGGKKKELDLEAAARLGDKIFWLGSHSNNKNGKIELNRRQLFATTITETNGAFHIAPAGLPYRHLVEDLASDSRLEKFKLAEAAAAGRAPKDAGGFNLEGICATPDGHLLIGFRNPIPHGRALLVPLLNPEAIIHGEQAQLGYPIQLDLQGRGIRDLILVGNEYFIIAGDYRGGKAAGALISQIYQWDGHSAQPRLLVSLPQMNPEALIAYPDTGNKELQVLSDDGQKPPLPSDKRTFRSVKVDF